MTCNKLNHFAGDLIGERITKSRRNKLRNRRGKTYKQTIKLVCQLQALEDLAKGRIRKI